MADNDGNPRDGEVKTTHLPLFHGTSKEDVLPQEQIEAFCQATQKPTNAESHEMYRILRGNAMLRWNFLKISSKATAVLATIRAELLKDYYYRITGESGFELITVKQKRITDDYARP